MTNGEVARHKYVQIVNKGYQVFDKVTGDSLLGPNEHSVGLVWLWRNLRNQRSGDPVVLYDRLSDRWLISQFAVRVPPRHHESSRGFYDE